MWRLLAILGGVTGAVTLSQFPEFSQQYLQRLAGKVDALNTVVAEFDASAGKSGLTREQALAQMTGSTFNLDHQGDMRATFAQTQVLSANLAALRQASPLARLGMPQRLGDADTLQATWDDFKPAIPTTPDGAMTAGIGYVGGWAVVGLLWKLMSWPFRRRRYA
ncbi:MAG: DUF2937 family protein [Cypionkella sp.]